MTIDMQNPFAPATKEQSFLRMAIEGPSGSGKTFTSLRVAGLMLGGTETANSGVLLPRRDNGMARIAFVDTERGSARLYADLFTDGKGKGCYDVVELPSNDQGAVDPKAMIKMIDFAASAGYEYLIIDSLSHAWEGILDMKDTIDRTGKGNGYVNWRTVTPVHNQLVDKMLVYPGHVIGCMRTKTEYVIEKEDGKTNIKKVGTKAIQRDGVDFEFTVVYDMSHNVASLGKSRCWQLAGLGDILKPGPEIAKTLNDWLETGAEMPMSREEFIAACGVRFDIEPADVGKTLVKFGMVGMFEGQRDKYSLLMDTLHEKIEAEKVEITAQQAALDALEEVEIEAIVDLEEAE